jgi:hypothetical protein
MTTSSPATPAFVLKGNTIDELAKQFAELVTKTQPIEVVDSKKGGGQYGKWELGEGEGIVLANRELPLKAGIPLYLGMTVVFRKLTDPAQYDTQKAAVVVKRAATIDRLKAQLAALEGK